MFVRISMVYHKLNQSQGSDDAFRNIDKNALDSETVNLYLYFNLLPLSPTVKLFSPGVKSIVKHSNFPAWSLQIQGTPVLIKYIWEAMEGTTLKYCSLQNEVKQAQRILCEQTCLYVCGSNVNDIWCSILVLNWFLRPRDWNMWKGIPCWVFMTTTWIKRYSMFSFFFNYMDNMFLFINWKSAFEKRTKYNVKYTDRALRSISMIHKIHYVIYK